MELYKQRVIKVGRVTKLAVPPPQYSIYQRPCKCEVLTQQALAWVIQTAGDYYNGEELLGK